MSGKINGKGNDLGMGMLMGEESKILKLTYIEEITHLYL